MINERINWLAVLLLASLLASVGNVYAEACTYDDAKLAIQKGNQVRGLNLMTMAANDGDLRAVKFLSDYDQHLVIKLEEKIDLITLK